MYFVNLFASLKAELLLEISGYILKMFHHICPLSMYVKLKRQASRFLLAFMLSYANRPLATLVCFFP